MTRRDFDDFEPDDVLCQALRGATGNARNGGAADVLAELRPRLTSARRRYVATRVTAISSLLVMAVGLTAAVNASTPAGHIKVQAPAASTTPEPTSVNGGTTTSSIAHDVGNGSTRRATTTTTSAGGLAPPTTVASGTVTTAPTAPGATTPSTTRSTTPGSPGTTPGTTPDTTPGSPGTTSTTTPPIATTTTTSNTMQSQVFHTTAGDVTVSWNATHLVVDAVDPAPGWSYTTQYDDAKEVTVYFTRLSPPAAQHLHLELQGGRPVIDS
jgi:hypothetical protein